MLTIEPETFCGLKEIEQKTMKVQQKNPTVCNNYELLIKCHSSQTNRLAESPENWCVGGFISFEMFFSSLSRLTVVNREAKKEQSKLPKTKTRNELQ